jgi:RHS repeat-associated protein
LGYEYRKSQAGVSPVVIPLRFPGQYYDPETDLFQNWNRFYDPNIGRYSEPEPVWMSGRGLLATAKSRAKLDPVYAYASDNAIVNTDPSGFVVRTDNDPRTEAVVLAYSYRDPEAFQKMQTSSTVFYVHADNFQQARYFPWGLFGWGRPVGNVDLGMTDWNDKGEVDVRLYFNNIKTFSHHSPLWTMAHESGHAQELAGIKPKCIAPFCEPTQDQYAHKVTGEPVNDDDRRYWKSKLEEWRKANPGIDEQLLLKSWLDGHPGETDLNMEMLDPAHLLPR